MGASGKGNQKGCEVSMIRTVKQKSISENSTATKTGVARGKRSRKGRLEKVRKKDLKDQRNQGLRSAPKLTRATVRTSREMDFFSEKELITQTGHEVSEWPLVFVKESVDNALDVCEEAGITPIIDVFADATG